MRCRRSERVSLKEAVTLASQQGFEVRPLKGKAYSSSARQRSMSRSMHARNTGSTAAR